MKSNLTIILFLKDRHEYNNRFLKYFFKKGGNIKLIISDGGKKKISEKVKKLFQKNTRIKYISFPEDKTYIHYYKKILKSLKYVKTKFVLFADNDDFFIYENIFKFLKFLENKNQFIGAGGTMIGFNMIKKNDKDFKLSNLNLIYDQINLAKKSKIDRFNIFMKNFSDLPRNCIMKKDVLIKNYQLSSKYFENNIEVKDHFSALFNVIHGKIKIFNKPMIMHQTHLNSEGGKRYSAIMKNFSNKNFIKDLILLDEILSKKLKYKRNYVLENYFKNIIGSIIQNFSLKTEPSTKELYSFFLSKLKRKIPKSKNMEIHFKKKFYTKDIKKIVQSIEIFLKKNN